MSELCRLMGIDKVRSTPYHPQVNGMLERFHRTLNSMLGKVVEQNQRDWHEHLAPVMAAYRATVHEATGFTPNRLMFGREVTLPVDLVYGLYDDRSTGENLSADDYVEKLYTRASNDFSTAREKLSRLAELRKSRYDTRVTNPVELKPGQLVYYFCPRRYQNRSPKWQKMYTGPYTVVRAIDPHVIVIRKSPRSKAFTVHRDKLKIVQQEADYPDFGCVAPKIIAPLRNREAAEVDEDNRASVDRPKRNIRPPKRYDDNYCRRIAWCFSMNDTPSCDLCRRSFRDRTDLRRHCTSKVHIAKSHGLSTPPRSRQGLATAEAIRRRKRLQPSSSQGRGRTPNVSARHYARQPRAERLNQPPVTSGVTPREGGADNELPSPRNILCDVRVRLIRWARPSLNESNNEAIEQGLHIPPAAPEQSEGAGRESETMDLSPPTLMNPGNAADELLEGSAEHGECPHRISYGPLAEDSSEPTGSEVREQRADSATRTVSPSSIGLSSWIDDLIQPPIAWNIGTLNASFEPESIECSNENSDIEEYRAQSDRNSPVFYRGHDIPINEAVWTSSSKLADALDGDPTSTSPGGSYRSGRVTRRHLHGIAERNCVFAESSRQGETTLDMSVNEASNDSNCTTSCTDEPCMFTSRLTYPTALIDVSSRANVHITAYACRD